jgi:tetratricopeptide (TPR) repeat protein
MPLNDTLERAAELAKAGELAQSLEQYKRAAELEPDRLVIRRCLIKLADRLLNLKEGALQRIQAARIHAKEKRWEQMAQRCQEVLKDEPRHDFGKKMMPWQVQVWCTARMLLASRASAEGRKLKAVSLAEENLQRYPELAENILWAGQAHWLSGPVPGQRFVGRLPPEKLAALVRVLGHGKWDETLDPFGNRKTFRLFVLRQSIDVLPFGASEVEDTSLADRVLELERLAKQWRQSISAQLGVAVQVVLDYDRWLSQGTPLWLEVHGRRSLAIQEGIKKDHVGVQPVIEGDSVYLPLPDPQGAYDEARTEGLRLLSRVVGFYYGRRRDDGREGEKIA